MSIESLQQAVKDVILGSIVSFTTTNNGAGFCGVHSRNNEDRSDLLLFRSMYLSFYGLTEKDIEGLMPLSLMFHVFGIKDKAMATSELGKDDEDFIECILNLYRKCGVTEIKKDK